MGKGVPWERSGEKRGFGLGTSGKSSAVRLPNLCVCIGKNEEEGVLFGYSYSVPKD